MLAVISSSARRTGECGTPAAGVLSLVMALLAPRGFSTPSLPAQGGQRRFPVLNIERDTPVGRVAWKIRPCASAMIGVAAGARARPRARVAARIAVRIGGE